MTQLQSESSRHNRQHVHIGTHVETLMVKTVLTVRADASLADAALFLESHKISCAPVLSAEGRFQGAVSRTDLLRVGRRESAGHGGSLVTFPSKPVIEIAKKPLLTVGPRTSVSEAAALMLKSRVHRLFIEEAGALSGVFSTKELLGAIAATRAKAPVQDWMSSPLFTIDVNATLAHATDRLGKAHVSGLCVVDDDGWPVGTFTQSEALATKDYPSDSPLEEAMSHALACTSTKTSISRAAAIAKATRARRVLVVDDQKPVGVMSSLDFARVVVG